ncbi:MAG: MobF family relaxase, partial [Acidimicrobiales bacterium]
AGLIPRARGVKDPELALALAERDLAMQDRARALAERAMADGRPWVAEFGNPPSEPARRERWLREVSTVAAYRDRWHLTSGRPLGAETDVGSIEQQTQRQRAQAAIGRALAISRAETELPAGPVLEVEVQRGVEL